MTNCATQTVSLCRYIKRGQMFGKVFDRFNAALLALGECKTCSDCDGTTDKTTTTFHASRKLYGANDARQC